MMSTITQSWHRLVDYWGKQSLNHFCDLESSASTTTLSSYDGSLVSLIVVEGRSQITGARELEQVINRLSHALSGFLQQPHHAMEYYFASDPAKSDEVVHRQVSLARLAAENMNLDISDVFDERERVLPLDMRHETCAIAIWTRPSALSRTEAKEQKKLEARSNPADARQERVHDTLLAIHEAFVSHVHSTLSDSVINFYCHIAEKHEFAAIIRNSIYTEEKTDEWRARLPGDPVDLRSASFHKSVAPLLEDPLDDQLFNRGDNFDIDGTKVQIGSRIYAALDMELPPSSVTDFQSLLISILRSEFTMPFRASFLLSGDGASFVNSKNLIASMLIFAGATNKKIVAAYQHMKTRAEEGATYVGLQASFATWAPKNEEKVLLSRLERLRASLRGWGSLEATNLSGDPAEATLGSALALRNTKIGPTAAAPLEEALHMLPLSRMASPFANGTMILRSPDGKPMPVKVGSSEQTAWVYLIYAPMGRGKSVLISTMILDHVLTPQGRVNADLPRVGVIDIGPSSRGVIELLREGLPERLKHQAVFIRMREDEHHRINLLDTSLGLRYPLAGQRNLQKNILGIICSDKDGKAYDGMNDLISRVIMEAYRAKDDKRGQPNLYSPNTDYDVDDMLRETNAELPTNPTWWDVVDCLFNAGQYHHASLAQRHAVPTLVDISAASNNSKIQQEFSETRVANTDEPLITAFQRIITTATEEYPAIAGRTTFDIGQARVIAMDLEEVVPGNTPTGARKTGVMKLLARHAIADSWFYKPEHFNETPEPYRSHHKRMAEQIMESKRMLLYDEEHRSAGIVYTDAQLESDCREGRKAGLMIAVASQRYTDFSKTLLNLSTAQFILGAGEEEKQQIIELFGLQGAQQSVLKTSLTGPGPMGAPLLMIAQLKNKPEFRQFLFNKIGPIELWAFNTTMEDRHLRDTMYEMTGGRRTRAILARRFPKGSAVEVIDKMKKDLQFSKGNLSSEEASMAAAESLARSLLDTALSEND